ncbi:MAG: glycosyltransferase family 4 protein [Planctomycetales bacterium]|nr:glycosyltransferase family 4 protein [Planctomycetales bacterium]
MNVLVCHNFYRHAGGEDSVFHEEVRLLESYGHHVVCYTRRNDEFDGQSKLRLSMNAVWNRATANELAELVRRENIQVAHFHNTWPLISAAGYSAVRRAGAAVVQTLHNYRLLCPGGTLCRQGKVCEACVGKVVPWPAMRHGCYRYSRFASTIMASATVTHRMLGTFRRHVDRFIALSEFARDKFQAAGLPRNKLVIKPNFVIPPTNLTTEAGGNYALFVGRLSPEKGVQPLLAAWRDHAPSLPLKIVGDGPQSELVESEAGRNPRMEYLGRRAPREVYELIRGAAVLVVPSVNYEGFPRTIVEAFAVGTPVIASRLGSMIELIEDGCTGAFCEAGNPASLVAAVNRLAADPAKREQMGMAAKDEFQRRYTPERNHAQLLSVYDQAVRERALTFAASRSTGVSTSRNRSRPATTAPVVANVVSDMKHS